MRKDNSRPKSSKTLGRVAKFALAAVEQELITNAKRRLRQAIVRFAGSFVCHCPLCGQHVQARTVRTRDFFGVCIVAADIADARGVFNWHELQTALLARGLKVQPGYSGAKDLGLIAPFEEDGVELLAGWWRLTSLGSDVAHGVTNDATPAHVYVYDNEVVRESEERYKPVPGRRQIRGNHQAPLSH